MKKQCVWLFNSLRRHQWAMVGALACTAFGLGLVGLYKHTGAQQWSWPDAIYFTLRLFGFNFDLDGGGTRPYADGNWQLWAASFLAPVSTALAVVKTVARSLASRLDLWRVSLWRGHAVVCGAGERGHHLALSLRREGRKVVVVDEKDDLENLTALREKGVRTIRGNARDPATLVAANVRMAGVVVALTPSVETNLEVILAATQRKKGGAGKALAYAPRAFATMFEGQKPFRRDVDGSHTQHVECSFFDHNATAARVLVNKHAPDLGPALFREQRGARILVAGNGEVVPELLGALITQCQFTGPYLPQITLLTCDPDAVTRGFPLHHPQRSLVVDLQHRSMTISQMLAVSLESLAADDAMPPYDLAFASCKEDGDTLALATNLAQQVSVVRSVIAGLSPSTRLEQQFQWHLNTAQPLEGITLYNLLTLGCEAHEVVCQELDKQAQEIHAAYVAQRLADDAQLGDTMALHRWEDLRGDFRQANRSQADHIAIKLRLLALSQSEHTIELLAEAEHRRWMADRIVSGWRYAGFRDDKKRLHPSIRPYGDLSEADREKDRDAVRTACGRL